MVVALLSLFLGCTPSGSSRLVLDGPARVRVESKGPVSGPTVMLEGGQPADGVVYSVTPGDVAQVDGNGQVVAVGLGTATVTADRHGQKVSWTLVVAAPITLEFVDPPSQLAVGGHVTLAVDGKAGDQMVQPSELHWSSSDPRIATVSSTGEVVGVAAGTDYVTVTSGTSEAMLELDVR